MFLYTIAINVNIYITLLLKTILKETRAHSFGSKNTVKKSNVESQNIENVITTYLKTR